MHPPLPLSPVPVLPQCPSFPSPSAHLSGVGPSAPPPPLSLLTCLVLAQCPSSPSLSSYLPGVGHHTLQDGASTLAPRLLEAAYEVGRTGRGGIRMAGVRGSDGLGRQDGQSGRADGEVARKGWGGGQERAHATRLSLQLIM